jgi:ATP-dependent protease ClpP protease subunit
MSDSERLPTQEETARIIAETDRTRAETAKLVAEAGKASEEAENARNMAICARYAREAVEREAADLMAGDDYHGVYRYVGGITETSVKLAMHFLTSWHRQHDGADIEIIFTSGGGDVISGMALFDFILDLRHEGHRVTTSALGEAASMAGILLQAGDWRTMGAEATLMIHEATFRAEGKTGEHEDTLGWIKKVQERILKIFASRSTLTIDEIRAKWYRSEWYLDSDEALRLGLIDAIR